MAGGGTQGFVSRFPDGTWRFLPFDWSRQSAHWFCNSGTRAGKGWVPITADLALADCGDWPPRRVLGDGAQFVAPGIVSQLDAKSDAKLDPPDAAPKP